MTTDLMISFFGRVETVQAMTADRSLGWYNPALVGRFEYVLDAIHDELGDTELTSLQIGHGVDQYSTDPVELFESTGCIECHSGPR